MALAMFEWEKQMKRFLWMLTIAASVITGLLLLSSVRAANDAPQPLASRPAYAQSECNCSHLKTLQIELRNAIRLQQAFRNKITELRTMNGDSAQVALKVFAEGEARRGLETVPDYKGPSEFDYSPWGQNQRTFNFPTEQLCGLSDSAKEKLDQAVAASACDGIGKALRAHEDVHGNMCRSVGYKAYLGMHGADRAREEVEAYEAQIAVLRAEIARVLNLNNCKRYKATGMYTGVVCSLEKPFTLTMSQVSGFQGHPQFTPSNSQGGSLIDKPVIGGLQWEDSGTYTVEEMSWGPDIVMRGNRCTDLPTGRFCTPYTNLRIALLPLDTSECDKQ